MIAKLVKGTGFRGALDYDLGKAGASILTTNMAGKEPRGLANEFGAIRNLRPNLKKVVCHASISLAPQESLTDKEWRDVTQKYIQAMGFSDCQYIATKHTDTEHPHIHIVVNRVTMRGEVVSDSNDFRKQEKLMRELEKKYELQIVPNSKEVNSKALTKNEVEKALRTGELPIRMQLQKKVKETLNTNKDLNLFIKSLKANNIEVRLNQAKNGNIRGISFALNGITMKGSSLGKGYSWNGLQKGGLYEQNGKNKELIDYERRGSRSGRNHNDGSPLGIVEPAGATQDREQHGVDQAFEKISKSNHGINSDSRKNHRRNKGFSR
ncbi:Relaxase/Mobilisation nuclease domain-containing protein [Maridesulfovibrio ferrireducens]|uniref:Relaxase/Mobilisation nuclease domain-containing protein n=1 Tax=Maridesulfovibrio ferrireducens TaxID=246191 RepID=A0A1G9JIG1_9BACT|nr:relaxase/mobilization nuclease domain-containing protein [Maridesulfovibrio ferrireducens]SDL37390.1 Relaxase/Mobilisation nuclease domain-containing protein [Maridesulfovibrio ferrireducens]